MGIKIGVCGTGSFADCFIPLFKEHPLVDEVCLADLLPDRLQEQADRFGISQTYTGLDNLCESDVDAIALYTQRWMHGPHAVQALESGKHVYSAVPVAISIEELKALVAAVEKTGLHYMIGETSFYTPSGIFCREKFKEGAFGDFVYGEGCYLHDMDHGFKEAYQHSGGDQWKSQASFPPMYYPTHSVGHVLTTIGGRMTSVSCLGFTDKGEDGLYIPDSNMWNNEFSNCTALFRTSNGGMSRINEFRRVGYQSAPGRQSVRLAIYGTKASFDETPNSDLWIPHTDPIEDLTAQMTCAPMPIPEGQTEEEATARRHGGTQGDFFSGLAPVHPGHRLPKSFKGLPNGHTGSHQFLVDDFVKSVSFNKIPLLNVWQAAKFSGAGVVAMESARQEGKRLEVPDFGEPPADSALLDPEQMS